MNEIKVTIVLGSPASNCAKYGVCSIEELQHPMLWDQFIPQHHRHVKAIISSEKPGFITIQFPTAVMLSVTAVMFFSKRGFLVESSGVIPDGICEKLHLAKGSGLATGVWAVSEAPDVFKVEIPVTVAGAATFSDVATHFNC